VSLENCSCIISDKFSHSEQITFVHVFATKFLVVTVKQMHEKMVLFYLQEIYWAEKYEKLLQSWAKKLEKIENSAKRRYDSKLLFRFCLCCTFAA